MTRDDVYKLAVQRLRNATSKTCESIKKVTDIMFHFAAGHATEVDAAGSWNLMDAGREWGWSDHHSHYRKAEFCSCDTCMAERKDVEGWKAKYYPNIASLNISTWLLAAKHSLRKWEGYTPEALLEFGLKERCDTGVPSNNSTCALCLRVKEMGAACPLAGVKCGTKTCIEEYDDASPARMIVCLTRLVEDLEKREEQTQGSKAEPEVVRVSKASELEDPPKIPQGFLATLDIVEVACRVPVAGDVFDGLCSLTGMARQNELHAIASNGRLDHDILAGKRRIVVSRVTLQNIAGVTS